MVQIKCTTAECPHVLLTSSNLQCFTEWLLSTTVECPQTTLAGVYFYGASAVDDKGGIFKRTPLASILIFRRVRKIAKRVLALSCLSVSPYEQLGFHSTDFHKIWYFFEIL